MVESRMVVENKGELQLDPKIQNVLRSQYPV